MKNNADGDKKDKARRESKKNSFLWPLKITIISFLIAAFFGFFSETSMKNSSLYVALILLVVLISVGIGFDIIGIAFTAADPQPFASMAARKMRGAKMSLKLLKNADRVSNICNDVVGDTCGIASGAAGAHIALTIIVNSKSANEFITGVLISSVVAAVTVGGKAAGKSVAISRSKEIVSFVGSFLSIFEGREKTKKG